MNPLTQPKLTGILWLVARLWLGYEWLHAGIEKVFGEGSVVWVGSKAGTAVAGAAVTGTAVATTAVGGAAEIVVGAWLAGGALVPQALKISASISASADALRRINIVTPL